MCTKNHQHTLVNLQQYFAIYFVMVSIVPVLVPNFLYPLYLDLAVTIFSHILNIKMHAKSVPIIILVNSI